MASSAPSSPPPPPPPPPPLPSLPQAPLPLRGRDASSESERGSGRQGGYPSAELLEVVQDLRSYGSPLSLVDFFTPLKASDLWCRYCGARVTSQWGRSSEWGNRYLCNPHYLQAVLKRGSHPLHLTSIKDVSTDKPANSSENSEFSYLMRMLTKVRKAHPLGRPSPDVARARLAAAIRSGAPSTSKHVASILQSVEKEMSAEAQCSLSLYKPLKYPRRGMPRTRSPSPNYTCDQWNIDDPELSSKSKQVPVPIVGSTRRPVNLSDGTSDHCAQKRCFDGNDSLDSSCNDELSAEESDNNASMNLTSSSDDESIAVTSEDDGDLLAEWDEIISAKRRRKRSFMDSQMGHAVDMLLRAATLKSRGRRNSISSSNRRPPKRPLSLSPSPQPQSRPRCRSTRYKKSQRRSDDSCKSPAKKRRSKRAKEKPPRSARKRGSHTRSPRPICVASSSPLRGKRVVHNLCGDNCKCKRHTSIMWRSPSASRETKSVARWYTLRQTSARRSHPCRVKRQVLSNTPPERRHTPAAEKGGKHDANNPILLGSSAPPPSGDKQDANNPIPLASSPPPPPPHGNAAACSPLNMEKIEKLSSHIIEDVYNNRKRPRTAPFMSIGIPSPQRPMTDSSNSTLSPRPSAPSYTTASGRFHVWGYNMSTNKHFLTAAEVKNPGAHIARGQGGHALRMAHTSAGIRVTQPMPIPARVSAVPTGAIPMSPPTAMATKVQHFQFDKPKYVNSYKPIRRSGQDPERTISSKIITIVKHPTYHMNFTTGWPRHQQIFYHNALRNFYQPSFHPANPYQEEPEVPPPPPPTAPPRDRPSNPYQDEPEVPPPPPQEELEVPPPPSPSTSPRTRDRTRRSETLVKREFGKTVRGAQVFLPPAGAPPSNSHVNVVAPPSFPPAGAPPPDMYSHIVAPIPRRPPQLLRASSAFGPARWLSNQSSNSKSLFVPPPDPPSVSPPEYFSGVFDSGGSTTAAFSSSRTFNEVKLECANAPSDSSSSHRSAAPRCVPLSHKSPYDARDVCVRSKKTARTLSEILEASISQK